MVSSGLVADQWRKDGWFIRNLDENKTITVGVPDFGVPNPVLLGTVERIATRTSEASKHDNRSIEKGEKADISEREVL